MITFRTYIVESAETINAFENVKKIVPFIKSDKVKSLFSDAADFLSTAAKEKEIYNARFGEARYQILRGIEYAYKTFFDDIKDEIIADKHETSDLWFITTVNDINKVAKIYKKIGNSKANEFMKHVEGIPNALKMMKSYVKAGKPPKAPDPNTFVKPMASVQSTKLAKKFMTEASDSFKKGLEKSITEQLTSAFDKIKELTDPKQISKDPTIQSVASRIFIIRTIKGVRTLELKDGAESIVNKMIADNVSSIIDSFINKNIMKLSLIFQKKGEPKNHKILRTNIRNGLVENSMAFEFVDGSSFVLESSVIYKTSKTGKYFTQYPTRFTNVKMTDGSSMKGPSEEKMIKEF